MLTACRLGRYSNADPIGSSTGTVNVAGRDWELHAGNNGAMKVYSFVASGTLNSFSADVKDFFNYLESNENYPASSQNLIGKATRSCCIAKLIIPLQSSKLAPKHSPAAQLLLPSPTSRPQLAINGPYGIDGELSHAPTWIRFGEMS